MNAERSKVYYTAVFLHVSFQAIKRSMAGRESDSLPCWLDTNLLMMLSRELRACRDQGGYLGDARQALDAAYYHCGLLLAQCPGGLNSKLCHQHLDAILLPLQQAIEVLAAPCAISSTGFWQATARRLRRGWRR
ncbi:hypothetical protein MKP05_20075 [Halomonas sp. EGI 63088]|uniref:Uncharacterized protein n=1 Tax=Halomonas flagellata TaxID=2920385 RepID=A0ABS9RZZ1_9GAMM|nr:hypothetical protein [Halomonas flagellata]MCH4565400.1 hypothetical protein [Halomonas flagellata]